MRNYSNYRWLSWLAKLVNYSYLRIANHGEIGVICTNLAIERGPRIIWY